MSVPIACSLHPDDLKRDQANLLPGLAQRATVRRRTPDGTWLQFAATGDVLRDIIEAIDRERRCCPFLNFQLTVPSAGEPLSLMITGPQGTQAFLEALLEVSLDEQLPNER